MAIKTIYKYEVPGKITAKVKRFLQPHMEHGVYCGTVMADLFVWHIYAGDMEKCGLNLDPCSEIENPF